jgi:hypothetical protein
MKYLNYVSLAGLVILIIIIKMVPSSSAKVSEAATDPTGAPSASSAPSQTEVFLSALTASGLHPMPLAKVNKKIFSVQGLLVAFANDNIQIYEYPTNASATADAQKIHWIYANALLRSPFRGIVHLYEKENLLVFYMGNKEDVIRALGANLVSVQILH